MNPVPLSLMLILFAACFTAGFGTGYGVKAKADAAEQTRQALAASQAATNRANKTTEIISDLAQKPDLDSDTAVADRLRRATCDSARLPSPAVRVRPPRAATARPARTDSLAAEMKQCVRLADEYDALRETWKANESRP